MGGRLNFPFKECVVCDKNQYHQVRSECLGMSCGHSSIIGSQIIPWISNLPFVALWNIWGESHSVNTKLIIAYLKAIWKKLNISTNPLHFKCIQHFPSSEMTCKFVLLIIIILP